MTPRIGLVPDVRDRLGECPIWDGTALFRVDGVEPAIHRLAGPGGPAARWPMPSAVGSIALGRPGFLLAALADGFHELDLHTGILRPLCLLDLPPGNRLNDGRVDRQGRFVCGTMQVTDDAPPGALFRLGTDGVSCERLEGGVGVSNAACFSPDGGTMYWTDSRVGTLWAYPYAGARPGPRQPFVADMRARFGSGADGAAVDAEGGVWTALVRTGQLARFRPDGAVDLLLDLPVPHPTCPAFGGSALDVLYVTSISHSGRVRSAHPAAGRLVAIEGLGVRGLPEERFGPR